MINTVVIGGRLVRDMEVRTLQSGTALGNFTIACDRPKYGDKEKQTDFIDCTIWGERASKLAGYLVKGKPICVVGALNVRNYEDQSGNKRKAVSINVGELRFLPDGKGNGNGGNGGSTSTKQPGLTQDANEISFSEDDIPF